VVLVEVRQHDAGELAQRQPGLGEALGRGAGPVPESGDKELTL